MQSVGMINEDSKANVHKSVRGEGSTRGQSRPTHKAASVDFIVYRLSSGSINLSDCLSKPPLSCPCLPHGGPGLFPAYTAEFTSESRPARI